MQDRNQMLEQLRAGVCRVNFIKADGSLREMRCTLSQQHMPAAEHDRVDRPARVRSDRTISAWDLDKKQFRSFRVDRVEQFNTETV